MTCEPLAPLDLTVNGRFLSQETTGVQRVGHEFVRSLDALIGEGALPGVTARLIAPPDARLEDLPLANMLSQRVGRLRGHAWEQFVLPRHVGRSNLLCLGNVAPLATLMDPRRRVALMLHDMSYRDFPEAYGRSYRYSHTAVTPFLLRYADPIITVSETERQRIIGFAPNTRDKVMAVQNGSWRDDRHPDDLIPWNERRGEGYGLYVGSFSHRKNITAVFEVAFRLARERGRRFVLIGAERAIMTQARADIPSDLAPLIDLRGQVESDDELERAYRGAAFLLFPSFYEASPLPPMEAMNFGCPVISSNIPATRERCGDAAEYCDPSDRATIHAAVDRLLDDPALGARLTAAGLARARQFSWRRQVTTVLSAIRKT